MVGLGFLEFDETISEPAMGLDQVAADQLNSAIEIAPLTHHPPHELTHFPIFGRQKKGLFPASQSLLRRIEQFFRRNGLKKDFVRDPASGLNERSQTFFAAQANHGRPGACDST